MFLFRCSFLFYAKIMQTECRISSLLGYYAEVQLVLCKDNANRMQNEINVFISLLRCSLSYAKIMHLILPSVVRIDFYTFIFAMRGCGVIPESFSALRACCGAHMAAVVAVAAAHVWRWINRILQRVDNQCVAKRPISHCEMGRFIA